MSGAASAQRPRTLLSPQRITPPVCFTCEDQRPLLDASGLVSFGTSEEETMSLMASDADEWLSGQDLVESLLAEGVCHCHLTAQQCPPNTSSTQRWMLSTVTPCNCRPWVRDIQP
ncbi:hypothetical protein G5714_001035 [Onychostoma macrolepis]|uniref:Uncharacterized protein n=1 Tax=Onychostoma macrolepis TaxID=369639 RepID=A0A7J6DJL1_9TELE|nr:hypothetical protein G5714_001035 [Onychostoma macrolepis]